VSSKSGQDQSWSPWRRRATTTRPTASFSSARKRKSSSAATGAGAARPPDLRDSYERRRLTPARGLTAPRRATARGTAAFRPRLPISCLRTTRFSTAATLVDLCCYRRPSGTAVIGLRLLVVEVVHCGHPMQRPQRLPSDSWPQKYREAWREPPTESRSWRPSSLPAPRTRILGCGLVSLACWFLVGRGGGCLFAQVFGGAAMALLASWR
jgi:hypothetical protein